ncbi:uncharacterized protein V6R79_012128 [Siganus canaliculatus]
MSVTLPTVLEPNGSPPTANSPTRADTEQEQKTRTYLFLHFNSYSHHVQPPVMFGLETTRVGLVVVCYFSGISILLPPLPVRYVTSSLPDFSCSSGWTGWKHGRTVRLVRPSRLDRYV